MANTNRGNGHGHAPGYVCYKAGNPKKAAGKKADKRKKITQGKQAAKAREALAGR
ncbi:MAG: hypothetical protein ACEQSB_01165 [Undibacterium sp.]